MHTHEIFYMIPVTRGQPHTRALGCVWPHKHDPHRTPEPHACQGPPGLLAGLASDGEKLEQTSRLLHSMWNSFQATMKQSLSAPKPIAQRNPMPGSHILHMHLQLHPRAQDYTAAHTHRVSRTTQDYNQHKGLNKSSRSS